MAKSWKFTEADGTVLGQRVTALDRAGLYVPGGKAAYPSSVLMNALPAKVAGVAELIMVVPASAGERHPHPMVLAAAAIAGVDRVFAIGGAQAIAALAYGTQTIPKVDKIVGPGNAYVAAAKRRVFGSVGIDMIAGPSEIVVICDGSTDPDWIVMDLFSQAEHDEAAQAILISPDAAFIECVAGNIDRLLAEMPRSAVISASLARRGALIHVRDLDQACEIVNQIAPEHLELSVTDPEKWLEKIRHAGAVFLGRYSSETIGDYCAGPNHVLPTSRSARFSSPLGVHDFQKRTSIIQVSREGAQRLGRLAATLARAEGLSAHARSAELRFQAQVPGQAREEAMSAGPDDIIRDEIRAMSAYHVASASGMVKLDAMENPYRLPQALRREIGELVADCAINRYPDPAAPGLKARLREVMAIPEEYGLLLGNGSDEIIQVITQAVARPGATVLAPEPTFVMYRMNAVFSGIRYAGVPLNPDFTLDLERFLAAMEEHRPALVFVAYPNNPTGNLFPEDDVARIIALAPGLVVLDEAYHVFAGKSFMKRLAVFPNLVVMRTVSKLGLAGLRLGYAAGRPEWIREFDKVRGPYNVNVITQLVADKVLEHHDVLEAQAREIGAERVRLAERLRRLPAVTQFPSDANFILARVPDAPRVFEGLKRLGVLVKNLHGSHALLEHCLRLTVGTPQENEKLIAALAEVLPAR